MTGGHVNVGIAAPAHRIGWTAGARRNQAWIFRDRLSRHQHCAKHFLNLDESWHALEGVGATAHQRLTWRKNLSALKCAIEGHDPDKCVNFRQCSNEIEAALPPYQQKTGAVILESFETGAVAFLDTEKKCLCVSADGVLVIMARLKDLPDADAWNVLTSFVAHDGRYEAVTETLVFERFFKAVDKAFQVIRRSGKCRLLSPVLWDSYKTMLLEWERSQ